MNTADLCVPPWITLQPVKSQPRVSGVGGWVEEGVLGGWVEEGVLGGWVEEGVLGGWVEEGVLGGWVEEGVLGGWVEEVELRCRSVDRG